MEVVHIYITWYSNETELNKYWQKKFISSTSSVYFPGNNFFRLCRNICKTYGSKNWKLFKQNTVTSTSIFIFVTAISVRFISFSIKFANGNVSKKDNKTPKLKRRHRKLHDCTKKTRKNYLKSKDVLASTIQKRSTNLIFVNLFSINTDCFSFTNKCLFKGSY